MEKTLRRGTAAISTASPSLRSPFILAIPIPLADNASPMGRASMRADRGLKGSAAHQDAKYEHERGRAYAF